MSSGALFPTLVPGSRGSSSKYLVEFRAGKMSLKSSTVTPDKRKGLVYIQQTDDSLIHFCWKDRTSGNVEDDLIIFPDDCEFKRVSQCTTGRVYVLKFKAGSKRLFFWMQEPKTEKDEEHCRKVNEYLNNPPMPGALGGSGSGGHELSALGGEGGLQSLLGNMSHNQLMQLIGPTGLGGLGGLGALTGPGLASLLGSGGPPTSSSSSRPAVPKVPFSRGNWTFWFFLEDVSLLIQDESKILIQNSAASSQKSIESMLGLEKSNVFQNMEATLQSIQESLVKIQETMEKNHEEIKNEFRKLNRTICKMDEKLGNILQKAEETEKKVKEVAQVNKGLEKTVIVLEMEKASYFLRFQNIEEKKGEDLMDVMTELLAGALQKTKQEVQGGIGETFRIHTNYAKRHKLPREVHVRFTKKTLRDEILKRSRDEPLKYKGKKKVTWKPVPRRVRDQRRRYQFLTTQLIKYKVVFRWLMPEGILVFWQDKRYRLDSLDKAYEFFDHHFTASEEQESREEIKSKRQEEIQAEEKTSQHEESENKKRERAEREGARAKEQRNKNNYRSRSQSTAVTPSSSTSSTRVTPAPAAAPAAPAPAAAAAVATSPSPAPSSGNGTSTATSPTQPIQLSDLQTILATMNVPAGTGGQQVDLSSVLTPEIMAPILANKEVQERLLPYLPSGESLPQTAEEIQNTLTSPQFHQALSMFSAALASGQLGPLMSQFGLPAEAIDAANKGDVEAFAKAMQNNVKSDQKEGEAKEKKDEEEDMSLD